MKQGVGGTDAKETKITSKGQITVPHEVRRALGIQSGDRLSLKTMQRGCECDL
jgi:AbrB family looped-hinge helix DNA binding protein